MPAPDHQRLLIELDGNGEVLTVDEAVEMIEALLRADLRERITQEVYAEFSRPRSMRVQ